MGGATIATLRKQCSDLSADDSHTSLQALPQAVPPTATATSAANTSYVTTTTCSTNVGGFAPDGCVVGATLTLRTGRGNVYQRSKVLYFLNEWSMERYTYGPYPLAGIPKAPLQTTPESA